MKTRFLSALFCLFIFSNCSINNNENPTNEVTLIQWNLINVTGGLAGVNNDFEIGDIVWKFDNPQNGLVTVINNNTDDTIEDALDSGQYQYLFIEQDDTLFIAIEDNEYGGITISEDELSFTINQNETTSGSGADGFIYEFEKTTVVVAF
jgi:hypothetical protein